MTTPIARTPSVIAAPPAPLHIPDVQHDIAAEQSLTSDALQRLGVPQLASDAVDLARTPGYAAVPVGSQVFGDSTSQAWTVIGVRNGNLDVARNVDGAIQRTSGSFGSFAEHTQQLMETPATADGTTGASLVAQTVTPTPDLWVASPATYDDVHREGSTARVTMVDYTQALAQRAARAGASQTNGATPPAATPDTFQTNWDDVLKTRNADQVKAVAVAPAEVDQAIALRRLLGDDRMVTSGTGEIDHDRERLIGTNSTPGSGKASLDYTQKTVDWFHNVAGVDVLPKGEQLVMHENNPEYLANASAGVQGDVTNINEGPHDEQLRQDMLRSESGKAGQQDRKINETIHGNYDFVLSHEWGHALRGVVWGEVFPHVQSEADLTPVQLTEYTEHSMVNEAMSDLYGAARSGTIDFGIRKVGSTQNQSADLDRYRALVERTPHDQMDVHFGTQLVSKPPLEIAKAHGFDALAAITGAADTDIGQQMKSGKIDIVSVPTAASALYAAAAQKFGQADPAVEAMAHDWQQLKVPIASAPAATT